MKYPDVIALEFDLLDWLRADLRLQAWRIACESLPGFNRDQWAKLFNKMPAVGTYCAQATYKPVQPGITESEISPLAIICAGANMRSKAAPRVGDEHEPGAGHIVEACRQVVIATPTNGTNIESMKPTGWQLVWCSTQIAVIALTIEVTLTRSIVPTPGEVEAYGSSYK